MKTCLRIAVLVEWSRAYGRGILGGIADYVGTHNRWKVFHTERRLCDGAPPWFDAWEGDGIIARTENPGLLEKIHRKRLPTVELFRLEPRNGTPLTTVQTDETAVAQMAADHLMDRGLRQFAYCGLPGVSGSETRGERFAQVLFDRGHFVWEYPCHREMGHREQGRFLSASEDRELLCDDAVAHWIEHLPKPVGLLACNDVRARQILMACDDRHIMVPEEVAVMGVDNDEIVCKLCRPSLSTIELDPRRVGYEAAEQLDAWIANPRKIPSPKTIAPKGVVVRQSTDVIAVSDTDVASAVKFIREHACDGINVSTVLQHVPVSRSTLERRFQKVLNRSPKCEIDRVQLAQVKRLLSQTEYPLAKIAALAGFRYTEGMCHLFRNTFGQTPGEFRVAQRKRA